MTQSSPYELGAEIVTMTDQTFDRAQPRVSHYALDERRRQEDGGTLLSIDAGSGFNDPANHYGRLTLKICNRQSKSAVWEVFSDDAVKPFLAQPEIRDANFNELNEQIRADKQFCPRDADTKIKIVRDRHPRGGINYNKVSYSAAARYSFKFFDDDFDLNEWGDRHKVGVETDIAFTSDASDGMFRWRIGFMIQNRFDRPTPQARFTSQVDKFQKREEESPVSIERGYERRIDGFADQIDIDNMRKMLAIAKDLRPVVTHPDVDEETIEYIKRLWSNLKDGRPLEEPAAK